MLKCYSVFPKFLGLVLSVCLQHGHLDPSYLMNMQQIEHLLNPSALYMNLPPLPIMYKSEQDPLQ
jgi:hypothetical protein